MSIFMPIYYTPKRISDCGDFIYFILKHLSHGELKINKDVVPLVVRIDCDKCKLNYQMEIEKYKK